ncbi:MAG: AtpZ/AtpI family protein [Tissierellia bacterium]|nr:AtpZ/AtpI family protein [Tissierellia bacterium]
MKRKEYREVLKGLALISQIGISVVVPILLGFFFGKWLDGKVGSNYIFSMIFIIIGAGAGFLNIFKFGTSPRNKKK